MKPYYKLHKIAAPNWLKFPTANNSHGMGAPTVPTGNVAADVSTALRNSETAEQTKQREAREATHGMPAMAQKFQNTGAVIGRGAVDLAHDIPYLATELPQMGQWSLVSATVPGYNRFFTNASNAVDNSNKYLQNKLFPYHKDTPAEDISKMQEYAVPAASIGGSFLIPTWWSKLTRGAKAVKPSVTAAKSVPFVQKAKNVPGLKNFSRYLKATPPVKPTAVPAPMNFSRYLKPTPPVK